MKETTVEELKNKKDARKEVTLLDVREPHEVLISKIENSTLIPLNDLPARFNELDKDKEIVVMCRSGVRSAKACKFLQKNGFENVSNLKGGVNEWAKKIDASLPIY